MRKISYLFFIFIIIYVVNQVFVPAFTNAQDITYEEYLIKKGDTLWDISDSKLNNPFLWPKLWKENPYIKNPDLIYPNNKIRIPKKEITMPLVQPPEHKEAPMITKPVIKEFPVAVQPEKVIEQKPVEATLSEVISKRAIVNRDTYISSGWVSQSFSSIGQIITSNSNRSIFGKDDIIFLKTGYNLKYGDKLFVVRNVKEVIHPKTKISLGHLIKVEGVVQVVNTDSGILKAKVIDSFEEIRIGDGLIPSTEVEIPLLPDAIRTPDIQGYLIASHRESMLVSTGDIVYLDRGKDNGLMIGDTFDIFVDAHCFRILVGTLQIIALQPQTSTAIIVKSIQEINIGDMWGN